MMLFLVHERHRCLVKGEPSEWREWFVALQEAGRAASGMGTHGTGSSSAAQSLLFLKVPFPPSPPPPPSQAARYCGPERPR